MKQHLLLITIQCEDNQTREDARYRLQRWIEHYGHTTTDFGFGVIQVDTPMPVKRKPKGNKEPRQKIEQKVPELVIIDEASNFPDEYLEGIMNRDKSDESS